MLTRNFFRPQAGRLFCRHSSTTYPFRNVNALRFQISQEEAIVRLAPYASTMLALRQFIGSMAARFLPGYGFEPIRPAQIVPVYFPAWVFDAELQASITCNDIQRNVSIQLLNSYLPGNHFEVMSSLSFWNQDLEQHEVVPFTSELETQHGMQVQCLPYSISPFSVLDITKYWPHGDVEIADGLHISPTSIKPTLIAAYPVLIPLYYVHYHVDFPVLRTQVNMTMVMEASSKKGRIFAYKYNQHLFERMPNVAASFLRPLEAESPSEPLYGDFVPFVRIPEMNVHQAPGINALFMRWLDKQLQASESLYPLLAQLSRDTPALQGKDQRVRDFLDEEDRTKIQKCLTLGSEISLLEMFVEVEPTKFGSRLRAITQDSGKSLQERVDEFEKRRRESFPLWWEEWKRREHGTVECVSQRQNP